MSCFVCCAKTTPDDEYLMLESEETKMMETIDGGNFDEIEKIITPRNFQKCEPNYLRVAMEVIFRLRKKGNSKGPDYDRFHRLADSVEEFIYHLLDPMRPETKKKDREQFGEFILDYMMGDAVDCQQKKFFTHPVVHEEMQRKWYGRKGDEIEKTVERFKYLEVPFWKFIFDTISYITLVYLHLAICVSPSTLDFSVVEWLVLVFFLGRALAESKQLAAIAKRRRHKVSDGRHHATSCNSVCKPLGIYLSDVWHKIDFLVLLVYFAILILRVYAIVFSGQVRNNRALVVANYLYGINVLGLSYRAFGHVMQQFEGVGTIQIALFNILGDIRVVLAHFALAILAFSFAITKVYVAKKSFTEDTNNGTGGSCEQSGISCWWAMFIHLLFLIVGLSKFNPVEMSMNTPSEVVALLQYAAFLVLAIIFLKSLMVSVLCQTYQQIKENSLKEWAYKKAITIEVYSVYDPIPVPFNIIYSVGKCFYDVIRAKKEDPPSDEPLQLITNKLEELGTEYNAIYRNLFPVTSDIKLDRLLDEMQGSRQMATQIICSSFNSRAKDLASPLYGPKAWLIDPVGIQIEGHLLTCECGESCRKNGTKKCYHGATYRQPLSESFPHFEVTVLETGKTLWPGIGLVREDYSRTSKPGWEKGSLGYHLDDGKIYHSIDSIDSVIDVFGKENEGHRMARRGDLIRCTAMFENSKDNKVPVCFTLNGKKIVVMGKEDETYRISYFDVSKEALHPYIALSDGSSVLTKICP
ncbi:short transient receptor potential channel 6-like isoform X2 [Montipora foliosa]